MDYAMPRAADMPSYDSSWASRSRPARPIRWASRAAARPAAIAFAACRYQCHHRRAWRPRTFHARHVACGLAGDAGHEKGSRIRAGKRKMENFTLSPPRHGRSRRSLLKKAKDGKLMAGGMTLLPTMKQGLAAPDRHHRSDGHQGFTGIESVSERQWPSRRAPPMPKWQPRKRSRRPSPPLRSSPADRRRACPPQGHHRRLDRQQRPGCRLSVGLPGLGATIDTNKRKIAADKFFTGMFETALKSGEIITAVHFPIPKKAAYIRSSPTRHLAMPWSVSSCRRMARARCVWP